MATKEALDALDKTKAALDNIKDKLKAIAERLHDDDDDERALAQAAIALSISTLSVMGARLRGLDKGRAADDPLRQELNRIRKVLLAAQKKRDAKRKLREVDETTTSPEESTSATQPPPAKKHKH